MRPKKTTAHPVMDFFTEDVTKEVWTCNVLIGDQEAKRPCGSKFSYSDKNLNKGNRMSNLKCHLNRYHPNELKETEEKEKKQRQAMSPGIPTITRQTSVTQFFESEEITIPMTAAKLKKGIVVEIIEFNEWIYFLALFENLFYLLCQDPECTKIGST
jgi:hypothetical protein